MYLSGAGGVRIAFDDVGPQESTTTVVLLHGGAQTRHSWGAIPTALSRAGYRSVAIDLRGHGDSDWAPDGDYSPDALVGDVEGVVAYVGGPVVLVGASLGGLISILYAARHPDRVRAVVLIDVVPENNPVGVERIRRFLASSPEGFANFDEVVDAVAAYRPHLARPEDTSGLWHNLRKSPSGRLVWHWDRRFLLRDDKPWTHGRHGQLAEAARRLRQPTLLLVGGDSDVVDEAAVSRFRELLPTAIVRTVPGTTHMIVGDDNAAFATELLAFLAELAT